MTIKRFIMTADTHGKLPTLQEGEYDFLCVAGDIAPHYKKNWSYSDYFESMLNEKSEAIDQKKWMAETFLTWSTGFESKNLVLLNGNHDFYDASDLFQNYTCNTPKTMVIDGVKFGFLPGMPKVSDMWFDEISEDEFDLRISKIDRDIDVLISHCPPSQILDKDENGSRWGSRPIYKAIFGLRGMEPHFNKLKLHIFGHVHTHLSREEHEIDENRKVKFINASCKVETLTIDLGE